MVNNKEIKMKQKKKRTKRKTKTKKKSSIVINETGNTTLGDYMSNEESRCR